MSIRTRRLVTTATIVLSATFYGMSAGAAAAAAQVPNASPQRLPVPPLLPLQVPDVEIVEVRHIGPMRPETVRAGSDLVLGYPYRLQLVIRNHGPVDARVDVAYMIEGADGPRGGQMTGFQTLSGGERGTPIGSGSTRTVEMFIDLANLSSSLRDRISRAGHLRATIFLANLEARGRTVEEWLYHDRNSANHATDVEIAVQPRTDAAVVAAARGAAPLAFAQPQMTDFDPAVHGYKFANSFVNIFVGDWTTNGLCGGMVYSALDHFNARRPIPRWDRRPPNGTPLQQHIYFRQVHSVERNVDKWAEVGFNPSGARSSEFFKWGIQGFDGGRLQELRQMIDRGRPVPLGLQEYGEGTAHKSHQVLAIGYALGRYTGTDRGHRWFGANPEDLKIFVYDPNHPNERLTLRPDTTLQGYYYEEWRDLRHGTRTPSRRNYLWRTYFVDGSYTPATPPRITTTDLGPRDGRARELWVEIKTGSHRLPGGRNNLDVTINYEDGPPQVVRNINRSHEWVNDYWESVPIALDRAVAPAMISSVEVRATGTATFAIDRMNLRLLGGFEHPQTVYSGDSPDGPLARFSSRNRSFTAVIGGSLVNQVTLEIRTGSHPLPGGDQNLNVIVAYRGGVANLNNANRGARWERSSTKTVTVNFRRPVRMSHVRSVTLIGQVSGASTWTIDALSVRARRVGGGPEVELVNLTGSPAHRFTSGTRSYLANVP